MSTEPRIIQQVRQHVAEGVMLVSSRTHADTISLPSILSAYDALRAERGAANALVKDFEAAVHTYRRAADKATEKLAVAEAERDAAVRGVNAIADATKHLVSDGEAPELVEHVRHVDTKLAAAERLAAMMEQYADKIVEAMDTAVNQNRLDAQALAQLGQLGVLALQIKDAKRALTPRTTEEE